MSDSKLARRGKQAAGLLAGVALFGGSLAVLSSAASAVVLKTPVDLAASTTTTETSPINRLTTLHASSTISNVGVSGSARGTLTIVVAGTTTATVTPPSGLSCGSQVPTTTGFSVTCTTDAALAPGDSKTVTLDVSPSSDPKKTTLKVTSTAKLINGYPATTVDPNMLNNKGVAVVKVGDITDVRAVLDGPTEVAPTGTYIATAAFVNNGPNAVYGKLTLVVARATEATFTPPAEVTCTAAVLTATGYTRSCTTNAPVASGDSVEVVFTATPTITYPYMKVTVKAAKMGAAAVDPNLLNNSVISQIPITDGIIPGA